MLQDRALLLILLELAHLAARTDAYAHTTQSCFNIPGFALRLDEGAALWKIHCGGWCGICHGCGIPWHTLAYSGPQRIQSTTFDHVCGCFCVLVSYQPIYLVQKALTHSYYLMRIDRSISLLKRGVSSSAWYEDTLGICPSPSPLCLDGPHRTTHPPTQAKPKALQRALAF